MCISNWSILESNLAHRAFLLNTASEVSQSSFQFCPLILSPPIMSGFYSTQYPLMGIQAHLILLAYQAGSKREEKKNLMPKLLSYFFSHLLVILSESLSESQKTHYSPRFRLLIALGPFQEWCSCACVHVCVCGWV